MSRKERKVSALRWGAALSLSMAMALSGLPTQALAEAADQLVPGSSADLVGEAAESGTWGTCPWEIDDDGVLTVRPGEGEDTYYSSPWSAYSDSITEVVLAADETGKVILPADSSYLFAGMDGLSSVDLSGADSSKVTSMNSMFEKCTSLEWLSLSGLDTSSVTDMDAIFRGCSSLESLSLSGLDTLSVTNMSWMFYGCSSLASLDLSGLDTSSVTDMSWMFSGCSSLASLKLSGWNTSEVATMAQMFSDCSSLTLLNLFGWNTSKVEDMSFMFYGCPKLRTVIVGEGWSTASVEMGNFTFYNCTSLVGGYGTKYSLAHMNSEYACVDAPDTPGYLSMNLASGTWGSCPWEIDGNGVLTVHPGKGVATNSKCPWSEYRSSITKVVFVADETGKVVLPADSSCMFSWMKGLTFVDLSGADSSNVTSMDSMFFNCSSLESLDLSGLDTSKVVNTARMFYYCLKLASLDLSSWDTSSVMIMSSMFYSCSKLKTITVGKDWSTESILHGKGSYGIDDWDSPVKIITDDDWRTVDIDGGGYMFDECYSLVGGNGTEYSPDRVHSEYARVDTPDTPGYLTLKVDGLWGSCPWEIDAEGVLTVHPGEGAATGGECPWSEYRYSFTKVVFAADETGKVVLPPDSTSLFGQMGRLTSVDLSGADSSNVTSMESMFSGCSSLKSVDLSSLDTSKAANMSRMFEDCPKLASLDLSGWDTSSVTNMRWMFDGCKSLESLDVSGWNTSKVTDAYWMFSGCSELKSLDLSSWDTSSMTNANSMFRVCPKLRTITVGEGWSTKKLLDGDDMFYSCFSLVGGNGTEYSSDHVGTEYARVDTAEAPGYLTLKAGEAVAAPAFETANLTVGQQVGLTFWLYLPEADGLDYSGSYVELTVDDKAARTERVDLTDETPKDDKGRRGFAIDLTSVEMAEPVTATFHYENAEGEKTAELTYSVKQYFEDFDAAAAARPGAYSDEVVALVHSTADLGHFMQPFLSAANGWAIDDDYKSMDLSYREMDEEQVAAAKAGVADHRISGSVKGSGIKGVGARLSFGALTDIDVYLTPEDPSAKVEASASYGGRTFPAVQQADGRWLVRVEGLKPYDYGKAITVSGNGGTGDFTVNVSVLGVTNVDLASAGDEARDQAYASAYYLWEASQEA